MDMPVPDRAQVAKLLRQHHIIPTHQRLVIAQILFARSQHLSADQLLALVNQEHAEVSKATIYNTLNLFEKKQMVREVIVDPERVFYDTNLQPHPHFFDVEKGILIDIDAPDLRLEGLPPIPEGMEQERMDVIIRIRKAH